jgi:exodeoxyribonuclease VII large subunit
VKILPVRVQGVEAPPEIVGAIRFANRHRVSDLIITGRGGGSIEDLWAFNDERVARAIFASEIPVISAVGHEPDVTIADFVADCRAATPSNAAELAVPDISQERDALRSLYIRSVQSIGGRTRTLRDRLSELAGRRVMISPKYYIDDRRLSLDHAGDRLSSAMRSAIQSDRERYASGAASLDALSPLKVLGRGYAIARRGDGAVIKSARDVSPGDKIKVRLKKDEIDCTVD